MFWNTFLLYNIHQLPRGLHRLQGQCHKKTMHTKAIIISLNNLFGDLVLLDISTVKPTRWTYLYFTSKVLKIQIHVEPIPGNILVWNLRRQDNQTKKMIFVLKYYKDFRSLSWLNVRIQQKKQLSAFLAVATSNTF